MDVNGSVTREMWGSFPGIKLESGARIVVPRRWRESAPSSRWVGCPWPVQEPKSIAVFPEGAWSARRDYLHLQIVDATKGEDEEFMDELQDLDYLMTSQAEDLRMDKVGRLTLGPLWQVIDSTKEATLRGRGDHFLVLKPAAAEMELQRRKKVRPITLKRLRMT